MRSPGFNLPGKRLWPDGAPLRNQGKGLNGKTCKVHLDCYNQVDMLTKGGKSAYEGIAPNYCIYLL